MLVSVILGHVCFADAVVAGMDFNDAGKSGTQPCAIIVVDALIFRQCIIGASVSGGLVVI